MVLISCRGPFIQLTILLGLAEAEKTKPSKSPITGIIPVSIFFMITFLNFKKMTCFVCLPIGRAVQRNNIYCKFTCANKNCKKSEFEVLNEIFLSFFAVALKHSG